MRALVPPLKRRYVNRIAASPPRCTPHRRLGALPRRAGSRPAATADLLALSPLLRPGGTLLTEGNTCAAALARRLTRSPWAHVSIYVGPLEPGDDSRCIVEADISAGVRAVPLSNSTGSERASCVRSA